LIEQGYEVVTKSAHLTISIQHQFILVSRLVGNLRVLLLTYLLKLGLSLGIGPFASLFFEYKCDAAGFIEVGNVVRGPGKKHGYLINLYQAIREKKLLSILGTLRLYLRIRGAPDSTWFPTPIVQLISCISILLVVFDYFAHCTFQKR
jgi:hypothetical protein